VSEQVSSGLGWDRVARSYKHDNDYLAYLKSCWSLMSASVADLINNSEPSSNIYTAWCRLRNSEFPTCVSCGFSKNVGGIFFFN
jgi:hypothetical protein